MAKDILINTQSGDCLVSKSMTQTSIWEIVWGKLFDTDEVEYMNILVPSGYVNHIQYQNNQFLCYIHADYHPSNNTFIARLVVANAATGKYDLIQNYNINAPEPMGVVYYPTYTGKPQDINACQLPMVDVDGNFCLLFKQYGNSNFSRAIITSAKNTDFVIGKSDNQSSQLLAKCAPGKYYRFPTTGLDLTKYINSVVEHTDITSQIIKQYNSDSKQVLEAEFDSNTGDLQIVFTGDNVADDNGLTDPNKLDVSLFRMADDDFIRAAYKESQSLDDNNADFIEELVVSSNFVGLYDIGNMAELDKINPTISQGIIKADGRLEKSSTSYLGIMELEAGKMYAVNYPPSVIKFQEQKFDGVSEWYGNILFALYQNNKPMYIDYPFATASQVECIAFMRNMKNRKCFVPLIPLTVKFYAGDSQDYVAKTGYGIRPILDKAGNFNSILGLTAHTITGKLTGIVMAHSYIEDVKIDAKTNQILIIKNR